MHLGQLIAQQKDIAKETKKINISKRMFDYNIPRSRFYSLFEQEKPSTKDLAAASLILDTDYSTYLNSEENKEYIYQRDLITKSAEVKHSLEDPQAIYERTINDYELTIKKMQEEIDALSKEVSLLEKIIDTKEKYINLLEKQPENAKKA